jgi:hypothetical protein
MKKFLIASVAMLCGASIVTAQNAVTASPSPTPSTTATPGTATAENVVVTSIRRRKAKTRHSTRRFFAFPVSRRIHSASFMSAVNMQTCNTASMTC